MHLRGTIATLNEAAVPFGKAIEFMQKEKGWNLSKAICEGIDEENCCQLFQKLSEADWEVDSGKVYPDRLSRLKELLDRGAKAVVVSLVRDASEEKEKRKVVMHYTVVTEVSSTRLTTWDSQGKKIERNAGSLQYDGADVRLGYFYFMKAK